MGVRSIGVHPNIAYWADFDTGKIEGGGGGVATGMYFKQGR